MRTLLQAVVENAMVTHVGDSLAGARKGDAIAMLAFAHLHEGQTLEHRARFVTLDGQNRVTSVR
jgi:aspartate 1-decarboxylase